MPCGYRSWDSMKVLDMAITEQNKRGEQFFCYFLNISLSLLVQLVVLNSILVFAELPGSNLGLAGCSTCWLENFKWPAVRCSSSTVSISCSSICHFPTMSVPDTVVTFYFYFWIQNHYNQEVVTLVVFFYECNLLRWHPIWVYLSMKTFMQFWTAMTSIETWMIHSSWAGRSGLVFLCAVECCKVFQTKFKNTN